MPKVLIIDISINQIRSLLRADYHNPSNFHTVSQTARITIKGTSHQKLNDRSVKFSMLI